MIRRPPSSPPFPYPTPFRSSAHRIEGEAAPLLVVTDGAPGLIAGADPRRNGDDYPLTSRSDGLGPQKDPNSGRTRVESGPAGTHRPTTRRGSGIAQPSVPRARCPECRSEEQT